MLVGWSLDWLFSKRLAGAKKTNERKEGHMALDVYFKEDILNALCAAYAANEGAANALLAAYAASEGAAKQDPADEVLKAYHRGFVTALGVVGLAFGLPPSAFLSEGQPPGQFLIQGQPRLPWKVEPDG